MSVPLDNEEKKLEVEQEAAPTLSPREADVAEEDPNPAPEVEEAPVEPETSGETEKKENKENEEDEKDEEDEDDEDEDKCFSLTFAGKDKMSLVITLGQSCQQGLKTPENPKKMDEEKTHEEKTPDGEGSEAGCRRTLFQDDESGPNDTKLFEWEWENGFQLGIRMELLRNGLRGLKNLARQMCVQQDLKEAGLHLAFFNEVQEVEEWLAAFDFRDHNVEEFNRRIMWCLRQFLALTELACQGGALMKLIPAETFEKSLWSDLSGLREGRRRDSTLSD
jgi:hypothetical protein